MGRACPDGACASAAPRARARLLALPPLAAAVAAPAASGVSPAGGGPIRHSGASPSFGTRDAQHVCNDDRGTHVGPCPGTHLPPQSSSLQFSTRSRGSVAMHVRQHQSTSTDVGSTRPAHLGWHHPAPLHFSASSQPTRVSTWVGCISGLRMNNIVKGSCSVREEGRGELSTGGEAHQGGGGGVGIRARDAPRRRCNGRRALRPTPLRPARRGVSRPRGLPQPRRVDQRGRPGPAVPEEGLLGVLGPPPRAPAHPRGIGRHVCRRRQTERRSTRPCPRPAHCLLAGPRKWGLVATPWHAQGTP